MSLRPMLNRCCRRPIGGCVGETVPDAMAYATLVDVYAKHADWKAAEEVVGRMKAAGLTPGVICYTSLISAYARDGYWQVRRDLVRKKEREKSYYEVLSSTIKYYELLRELL